MSLFKEFHMKFTLQEAFSICDPKVIEVSSPIYRLYFHFDLWQNLPANYLFKLYIYFTWTAY